MRRLRMLAAAIIAVTGIAVAGSRIASLQGTAITINGNNLFFVDCRDSTVSRVVYDGAVQAQTGCERFYNFVSARFSPDGSRLVFSGRYRIGTTYDNYGIWVCDNDGSDIEFLHKMVKSSDVHKMNWASDGYIYWSEETDSVWRVSVTTKQPEIYWSNVGVSGYTGTNVKNICVSQDGRRAVSSSSGRVHALDMVAKRLVYTYVGGCDGAISGLGGYVVQKETVSDHEPSIALNTHSCFAFVWVFGSNPADLDTTLLWAVGWPETQDIDDRMEQPQGASNNDDYFVGQGRLNNAANSYVYERGTSNYYVLPNYVTDFFVGSLPPPPGGLRLAVAPDTLTFSSPDQSTPPPQTITVTASGTGTLGTVSVIESAAWLTVTESGSGNTRTLTNAVSVAGLTPGTYTATVTVTGTGASNSVNYRVTLNFGTVLPAPSNLAAVVIDSAHVHLTWADNSGSEAGFVIERGGTGSWAALASVAANTTAYTDSNLAPGTYTYRVRAFAGLDSSSWSNEASGYVAARRSMALTSPAAGDTLVAGTVDTIRWTAQNVPGIVLSYSLDGGENWTRLDLDSLNGSIQPTSPYWGAFPWQVPDVAQGICRIRIAQYTDENYYVESGVFAIRQSTGVAQARHGNQSPASGILSSTADGAGLRVVCRVAEGGAVLEALDLAGRTLVRQALPARPGTYAVVAGIRHTGVTVVRLRSASGTVTRVVQAGRSAVR